MIIKYPAPVDLSEFSPLNNNRRTLYGLPNSVHYCKRCVISNQRPNSVVEYSNDKRSSKKTIALSEDGVCDACLFAEQKQVKIDWQERERELVDLCDRFRRTDGSYDCIVPGSGGKDSFYASHLLKNKYGMHPLTVTWAPHIYTEWGWRNFQSWIHAGHDNLLMTPNGEVHRLLTRLALDNLYHPFQPFMIGQKSLAPKLSSLYGIPLVFYGENEAEYGNPLADTMVSTRDSKYFSVSDVDQIKIAGFSVRELLTDFGLTKNDLEPYVPLTDAKIAENDIQVHYLGYYVKWHPQSCYYYAVEHGGFIPSPERTPGTYSKYNSIDDRIDDLHYYTTGIKFGIGRASYDAAQEIRSGDIDRSEGVALVKRFDLEYPVRFENELFSYLSMDKSSRFAKLFEKARFDKQYFMDLTNAFRSPHLWNYENGNWSLRNPIWREP